MHTHLVNAVHLEQQKQGLLAIIQHQLHIHVQMADHYLEGLFVLCLDHILAHLEDLYLAQLVMCLYLEDIHVHLVVPYLEVHVQ